jgi:hypothetical protein
VLSTEEKKGKGREEINPLVYLSFVVNLTRSGSRE